MRIKSKYSNMFHQFINKEYKRLYSVYHEPEVAHHYDTGVVFCYPYGQEYIRCHKLYVNMANKLASHGFHALRFDYYGTGDSNGDFSAITINESLNDIQLVISEFKESFDISRVILFGVRMGGTLAVMHSSKAHVDALILWNPILKGDMYLKDIDRNYKKWLSGSFTKEKYKDKNVMENFGFQFSSTLVNDIKEVFIGEKNIVGNIPTLIFCEEPIDTANEQCLTYEKSANKEYWIKREGEFDKALVPVYEMNKTLEWLENLR